MVQVGTIYGPTPSLAKIKIQLDVNTAGMTINDSNFSAEYPHQNQSYSNTFVQSG